MALSARPKNVFFMTSSRVFAALCSLSLITSLDDFGAFLVQKLMAAIGAEELDFLVPELLPVAIKFAFALRTGHPKNFRHGSSWHKIIFTTETQSSPSSEYFLLKNAFLRVLSASAVITLILSLPRTRLNLGHSV